MTTTQELRSDRIEKAKTWKSRIKDLGLSHTEFAHHAKMGETRVSQILSSDGAPHPKTVKRMESALERLERKRKK